MTLPVGHDLSAYRGDTWSQGFRLLRGSTPVDLSAPVVVESEARPVDGGEATALAVDVEAPTEGRLRLRLPAASLPAGRYEYDVEVTEAGVVTTWIRGQLTVTRDVTNEPA